MRDHRREPLAPVVRGERHGAIELQGGFAVTVFFFITGFVMYLAYGDKACREDFKYWVRTRVVSRRSWTRDASFPNATLPHPTRDDDPVSVDVPKRRFGSRVYRANQIWNLERRVDFSSFRVSHPPGDDLRAFLLPFTPRQDFIKRRYIRLVPVHWLCIATYAPVIAYNYATIANDYYFWQNASGEKHLWVGWALNPLFLSSWIFAPLHYWNSVAWSVSTQVGFYFLFPFVARRMKRQLAKEEGGLAVASSGADPPSPETPPVPLPKRRKKPSRRATVYGRGFCTRSRSSCRSRRWRSSTTRGFASTGARRTCLATPKQGRDGHRARVGRRRHSRVLPRAGWTPFRLPVFLLGSLFAARRERMRRNATDKSEDVIAFWASIVDRYAFRLILSGP